MKHSPPPAKTQAHPIALLIFVLALIVSACATRPQPAQPTSEAQLNRDSPKIAGVSGVNINTAAPAELERLPGIGAAIAERIIAHRQQYGHFRRVEHLLMVRGISDRKFRAIRPMISVD